MKVTTNQQKLFSPYTIQISVENKEEHKLLATLFGHDRTIPYYLFEKDMLNTDEERAGLTGIMEQIYSKIPLDGQY